MNHDTELRQEFRLSAQETVFIETAPDCIIISNSVDISANGLQIKIDQELPIGSIHQTSVQLDNPDFRLQLVTEVKWIKPAAEDDEFLIGLALFESEGTDIKQWKEMIAERCRQ